MLPPFARILLIISIVAQSAFGQQSIYSHRLVPVDSGWAQNSINTVPFRKNSVVTWKGTQYISFYNQKQQVVVAKRQLPSGVWQIVTTPFSGNALDAHNTISIMVDGAGYLHMAWNHHNNRLHYARSRNPQSLDFDTLRMTGLKESRVTYPEFYLLKNGNLLFLYRDGESGKGNLIMNVYETRSKRWSRLHDNLVNGENQRSAYWQACVDRHGSIHLSWVWRESPDVSSNHDLCYARSDDNGKTWKKLDGSRCLLPITFATADYALRVAPGLEMINQTSIAADERGNPYIVSYWRSSLSSVPQFQLVYAKQRKWKHRELAFRKTDFTLAGLGTKSIPVSRPQLAIYKKGNRAHVLILFRDIERKNNVSVIDIDRIKNQKFSLIDLGSLDIGSWEPTYDTELWKTKKRLNVFVQSVNQADNEGLVRTQAKMVYVLEIDIK